MPAIIYQRRPYHLYVEAGKRGAMAHVAELPGCFALGSSAAQAAAAAPGAIVRFLAWLKAHREPLVPEAYVARPSMLDLSVAEVREHGAPLEAGNRAALFPFDAVAWDDYKVERTLRWLQYSRADFLARLAGLSEDDLKRRLVAPDRSLWDTARHVANAEFGYIMHVVETLEDTETVSESQPVDVVERLAAVREVFTRHVRAIPQEKRAEVIYPTWTERPDEPWTLAKSMRRALEHELEHLAELDPRL